MSNSNLLQYESLHLFVNFYSNSEMPGSQNLPSIYTVFQFLYVCIAASKLLTWIFIENALSSIVLMCISFAFFSLYRLTHFQGYFSQHLFSYISVIKIRWMNESRFLLKALLFSLLPLLLELFFFASSLEYSLPWCTQLPTLPTPFFPLIRQLRNGIFDGWW